MERAQPAEMARERSSSGDVGARGWELQRQVEGGEGGEDREGGIEGVDMECDMGLGLVVVGL